MRTLRETVARIAESTFLQDFLRTRKVAGRAGGNGVAISRPGFHESPDSRAALVAELERRWPQTVAVDDATAYIGDRLNRRLIRVRLPYGADETRELRCPPFGGLPELQRIRVRVEI